MWEDFDHRLSTVHGFPSKRTSIDALVVLRVAIGYRIPVALPYAPGPSSKDALRFCLRDGLLEAGEGFREAGVVEVLEVNGHPVLDPADDEHLDLEFAATRLEVAAGQEASNSAAAARREQIGVHVTIRGECVRSSDVLDERVNAFEGAPAMTAPVDTAHVRREDCPERVPIPSVVSGLAPIKKLPVGRNGLLRSAVSNFA